VNKEHRLNDLGIAIEDLDMFQKRIVESSCEANAGIENLGIKLTQVSPIQEHPYLHPYLLIG
jgi:hypothetical protein